MSTTPFSHHELLALAEPYVQSGRQVDLAAADRTERRLAFRPREVQAGALTVRETLVLENPRSDLYRLTRTLTAAAGLEAGLRVEGEGPDGLLERLERVAPERHFEVRAGVPVARSYRLIPDEDAGKPGARPDRLVLAAANADLGGVTMSFNVTTGPGWPAEVLLVPAPGRVFDPPEDLLAVLGRGWKALARKPAGWLASVRVAKREPERTPDSERKLRRTLDHLIAALGAPPERFHARYRRGRWAFFARRWGGILVVMGALVSGPVILLFDPPHESLWRLLAFNTPNFLIFAWFLVREIPSVRPPRVPGPLPPEAWEPLAPPEAPPVAAGVGVSAPGGRGAVWGFLRRLVSGKKSAG